MWAFKLQTFKDANVHVVPARNRNPCRQHQAWVTWQLALHLLLLTTLHLYHLPPPLPLLQSVTLLACSFHASACMPVLYFSRYFSRHCPVWLKMFSLFLCLFCMYYLCEKYYKPITVQHSIANCISWVPRLILLDLEQTGLMNVVFVQNSFIWRGLAVLFCIHIGIYINVPLCRM